VGFTADQPITAGTTLIRSDIRSQNYVAGVSGWIIEADGDAEFNNVFVRGGIRAAALRNGYTEIASNVLGNPTIQFRPPDFQDATPTLNSAFISVATTTFPGAYGNHYGTLSLSPPNSGSSLTEIDLVSGGGVDRINLYSPQTVFLDTGTVQDTGGLTFFRGVRATLSITFAASASFTQAVVFPTAFPVGTVPNVHCNINALAGVTAKFGVRAASITNAGFTLWCTSGDGTAAAWAGVAVQYTAFA
jgi:hypothetical protein